MRWRSSSVVAVVTIGLLMAGACGSDDSAEDDGPAATAAPDDGAATDDGDAPATTTDDGAAGDGATPVRGGSLTLPIVNEVTNMSPFFNTGRTSTTYGPQAYAVYGGLFTLDPGGPLIPSLGESIKSEDGTTWVLTLKEGLVFTDDTPLDAEAVMYNYEQYQGSPGAGAASASLIESMEVLSPTELEITLAEPHGRFDRHIAQNLNYVVSPTSMESLGDDAFLDPVGAGPFVIEEWVPDSHMRLVRNEKYYDPELPYLDELTFQIIPDDRQRLNTVLAGDADVAYFPAAEIAADAEQQGLDVHEFNPPGGLNYIFNTRQPPFDDMRARQAIAAAIDLDDMNEAIQLGNAVPVTHLFPEDHAFYTDEPISAYDPERARELFDEYQAENGSLTFTIATAPGITGASAEYVQAILTSEYGIQVEIDSLPNAEHVDRVAVRQEFDVATWATTGIDPEPVFFQMFHSESPGTISGHVSEPIDEGLEAGREPGATDDERRDAYERWAIAYRDEAPAFFYFRQQYFFAHRPNVRGVEGALNNTTIYPEFLWIAD